MFDKMMCKYGFIMNDFHETFSNEENCLPEINEIKKNYSGFWPFEAEDLMLLIMRKKRIEWAFDEDEFISYFEYSNNFSFEGINFIVETVEKRLGLDIF